MEAKPTDTSAAPPLEEFLFERPCSAHLSEGDKRILVEQEDDTFEMIKAFQRYGDYIAKAARELREAPDLSTADVPSFLRALGALLLRDMDFDEEGSRLLSRNISRSLWDCDSSSFVAYDIARELGIENPELVIFTDHVLLKAGSSYLETTSGEVLNQKEFEEEYGSSAYWLFSESKSIQSISYTARAGEQGDKARAAEDLNKAIALDPRPANPFFNLAVVHIEDPRKAEADLSEAIARDPNQREFFKTRRAVRLLLGDVDGAAEDMAKCPPTAEEIFRFLDELPER